MTREYMIFRVCERFGMDPEQFERLSAGRQELYLRYGEWRIREEEAMLAACTAAARAR